MKLTSKPLSLVIFVFIFGGIIFTTAMNWWRTESTKQPNKISSGEAAGEYDPADIRGSYTFGDIESAFNIPSIVLAEAFGVADGSDPALFSLKNLETLYGDLADQGTEVGTSSVRYFVALYAGLPIELAEETYLPQPAVNILQAKGGLTAEDQAYIQTHTVQLPGVPQAAQPSVPAVSVTEAPAVSTTEGPAVSTEDHAETDRTVKGKTTFADVLSWGVTQEVIEVVLGKPMPNQLTVIRDYCEAEGLEFSTIKTALQAEVDKAAP